MISKADLRDELENAADVSWDFKQRLQESAMLRAVRYAYPNFLERVEQVFVGDAYTTRFLLTGDVVGLAPQGQQPVPVTTNRTRSLITAPSTAPTVSTTAGAGWGIGGVYLGYAWSLDLTNLGNVTQISALTLKTLATNQRPTVTIPVFPAYAQAAVIYASPDLDGNPDVRYVQVATAAGVATVTAPPAISDSTNPRPLREFTDIETFNPVLDQMGFGLDLNNQPNADQVTASATAVLQLRATTPPAIGEAFVCRYYRKLTLPTKETDIIQIDDEGFLTNAALGFYFSNLAAREKEPDVRDQYVNQQKLYLSEAATQKKNTTPPIELATARAIEWDRTTA